MVGMVVKANIDELKEEVRELFSIRKRKELTGAVKRISGKKSLLVRFQDEYENDLTLNQLTIVIAEKIPMEEDPKIPTIPKIPQEQVT